MSSPNDRPDRLAGDVHELTLGADRTLSVYLVDDEHPVVIESGVAAEVDRLLDGVTEAGVEPRRIEHVVVSHVHLDHSGGAAGIADAAPGATIYIHESTLHHLVDPSRLIESSREVLGKSFAEMGAPGPLSRNRLEAVTDDGLAIDCGSRELEVVHTPGHAPDHVSVWDPESRVLFANEAIGRYYPEADSWVPPVTVPRFSSSAVMRSIEALRAYDATTVALSHVGTRPDPDRAFERAARRLEAFVERIPRWYEQTGEVEATATRVREDLLGLEDAYPDALVDQQAELCTYGVLQDAGLLE